MKRTLLVTALCTLSPAALAVDGVIEINHARALAGGVTPGDTPGYPVTLNQSGSYRLTSNLTQDHPDNRVIEVLTDNATLDLNGFAIAGTNECTYLSGIATCSQNGLGQGIVVVGAHSAIFNGNIVGMGANGIAITGANARVENVHVSHCGGNGIDASSAHASMIRNNSILLIKGTGIITGDTAQITGNTVSEVGTRAVQSAGPSLISGNVLHTYSNSVINCTSSTGYGNNVIHRSLLGAAVGASCVDMGGNWLP